jgi:hypothetical protein
MDKALRIKKIYFGQEIYVLTKTARKEKIRKFEKN